MFHFEHITNKRAVMFVMFLRDSDSSCSISERSIDKDWVLRHTHSLPFRFYSTNIKAMFWIRGMLEEIALRFITSVIPLAYIVLNCIHTVYQRDHFSERAMAALWGPVVTANHLPEAIMMIKAIIMTQHLEQRPLIANSCRLEWQQLASHWHNTHSLLKWTV